MLGMIFAIDPGLEQSGWVKYEQGKIVNCGILDNETLLAKVNRSYADHLAIEMVASYGMPVGKEVFRTVWWSGRFAQAWINSRDKPPIEVYRNEVKLQLCNSARAKDSNIRQALIDLIGPQGTKKNPGPTYGVKSHAWAALGVAVTAEARL